MGKRRRAIARKTIRLPKAMLEKVKELVDSHPELYNSVQQFVESSIREKIEEITHINMETKGAV